MDNFSTTPKRALDELVRNDPNNQELLECFRNANSQGQEDLDGEIIHPETETRELIMSSSSRGIHHPVGGMACTHLDIFARQYAIINVTGHGTVFFSTSTKAIQLQVSS